MRKSPVEIVHAWHELLNEGRVDELVLLADEDVEVGGPRGSARGVQVMRDWFERAGVKLQPTRVFGHDNVIVVEQEGKWEVDAEQHVVASVFTVVDGLIASIIRYPDLTTALAESGLTEEDEIWEA